MSMQDKVASDVETLQDLVSFRKMIPILQSKDTNTLLGRLRE